MVITNLNPISDFQRINYKLSISPGTMVFSDSLYLELYGPTLGDSITFNYQISYDHHHEKSSITLPVYPWEQVSIWGDTLEVISEKGVTYNVVPIIADPSLLTGHTYQLSFYFDESSQQVQWWLIDNTTNVMKYQNGQISSAPYFSYPVIDGIQYKVLEAEMTIKSIECVANANGPIVPPEPAAASWQGYPTPGGGDPIIRQQVGAGKWLITTHGYGPIYYTYQHFLDRSFVRNGIQAIIPNDYEIRFTETGGKIFDNWDTETMVDVPFELWNVGNNPTDSSDDYQLFAYMFDADANGQFNLVTDASISNADSGDADHGISDGLDDPFTDRLYWLSPTDSTPGTQGYENLIASIMANPSERPSWSERKDPDEEAWSTFSRMVLVNWDGGDVTTATSPTDYNQEMPEKGSIFRIVTWKPNFPGDVLYIESPVSVLTENEVPVRFSLAQNYPNPFNPITNISFSLAKNCHVKLEIFNVLGQKVKTLIKKQMSVGEHSIIWNGLNETGTILSSGLYFYQINTDNFVKIKKMTLLK